MERKAVQPGQGEDNNVAKPALSYACNMIEAVQQSVRAQQNLKKKKIAEKRTK